MVISAKKQLSNHISHLKEQFSSKNILLVFKGFSREFLTNIEEADKLISLPVNSTLEILHGSKAQLLPEVFTKLPVQTGAVYWCTYEEFLTLGANEMLSLYSEIVIIKNNIFHKTFPALYEVQNMEELFNTHFKDMDEYIEDESEHPSFSVFSSYYGDLKLIGSKFYVTYAEDSDELNFFDVPDLINEDLEQSMYDHAYIELSEEEDALLEVIDNIITRRIKEKEVHITFSGELESFPNNYKNRIALLQKLYNDFYEIRLSTKTMQEKEEIDEQPYVEILKEYWGFDSFRPLKMYKNVNDAVNKKETITISQTQIIDDIVKQSKRALNNETPNDIFVTSPTGAGKSVMFQIPAIYLAKNYRAMTIVISPLIGLMADQVQGLQSRNVEMSATINSDITPVEKMEIIEKIKDEKISILYISPETLLSRSDITQLIGDRRIGLFVIDEAHIVTTWGKAFRSDYWYLGNYLQKLRKDVEKQFPIATFTATAIYGGIEDMYSETRDSLNLQNVISYFGYVKRDDLEVRIKQKDLEKDRFNEYIHDKFKILLARIDQFISKKKKTLVYFPTVKLIHDFLQFAKVYGGEEIHSQISYYYGSLEKDKKNANYMMYKQNESKVMLATKAFGMGIDIPDINIVYHFAPTGNVCDYIQEIGRAARDPKIKGYAFFDYLPKDFVHVNRLHGISTIKRFQLIQVMEKILKLLEQNDDNNKATRNLLVSADEFRYIFEKKNAVDPKNDDFDNKLKTALLIIEKGFKAVLEYSPLIARPRSIFATEYFLIQPEKFNKIPAKFKRYFRLIRDNSRHGQGNIYICNMKGIWEENFQKLSYPQFKHFFHTKDTSLKLSFLDLLQPIMQLELTLKDEDYKITKGRLNQFISKIGMIFGEYSRSSEYFSIEEFARELSKKTGFNKYLSENIAQILLTSADSYDRLKKRETNFYNRFLKFHEGKGPNGKYTMQSASYAEFTDWILQDTEKLFIGTKTIKLTDNLFESYLPKFPREVNEKTFILLGILEAFGLLVYKVNGGINPEIFIRINSRMQLDRVVKNPSRYENSVLSNVYKRHKTSVEMLTYLFKKEVSSQQFWDSIEDYFLGTLPTEVIENLEKEEEARKVKK
ncbi:DEAD/DEAH box helicase [Litchfieldia alkalitelluris]|uniref:DEAD/DEAH box helicase n=1 Tax=Litchfieldia alkalitelluris TaxID=304268 RepID=UPI0009969F52|nr:DEAD/DEAH box helicase [Litchfieldia alkalitelluris]